MHARFSAEAIDEYGERAQHYLVGLEAISRMIARQKSSDDVSRYHVQLAAEALGADGQKKYKRMAEIGGLLAGAGLGYVGNVVVSSAYSFANAVVGLIPLAVGCGLYFYAVGRDQ